MIGTFQGLASWLADSWKGCKGDLSESVRQGLKGTPAGLWRQANGVVHNAAPQRGHQQAVGQPQDGGGEDVRPGGVHLVVPLLVPALQPGHLRRGHSSFSYGCVPTPGLVNQDRLALHPLGQREGDSGKLRVGLTVRVSSAKPSNMREIREKKMTLKYWLPAQAQAI